MRAASKTTARLYSAAVPHESAHLHVSGEATYIDDIRESAGTLHAALGLSAKAHARIKALDLAAVRAMPGVVAAYTAQDIPGPNDCGPIIHDDPILADGEVLYIADLSLYGARAVARRYVAKKDRGL